MSALYSYLLKLTISLSVVYLFYQLFLRRLTFYNWNRWYLLGYTLIAFVIPFIPVNPILEKSRLHTNDMLDYIPVVGYSGGGEKVSVTDSYWTYEEWILLAISIGIVFMVVRLMIQHISLNRMKKQSRLLLDDSVRLYQVDRNIIPFSFGNTIFVNQHQHTQEELKEIIRHEFIHVKQRHTVDILWSEILCILNWYNPFVWLLRFAIRQNLEFIADYKVLENGFDKKEYQYLLLKVIGVSQFSIATKFNFTSLKKRIAMMNKMKSARVHLLKFLFILPLLAVLLLSFRDKFSAGKSSRAPYIRYEGLVVDVDTQQPVSGVTVIDQPSGKTTVSDKNGRYSFEFDKDSKKLTVFMVFKKEGYIKQEAAFFLEFSTDAKSSTGLMELVGMKQGKMDDKCKDCFSSISMKYEEAPEQISELDFDNWLKERTRNHSSMERKDPFKDWKLGGVRFRADRVYVSEDNGFTKITGLQDFNYSEPAPQGLVIYKNKEYSLHDFAVEYGFLPFKTVYLFQGKTAYDRYGNKGRHGVMYVVDPVLNDTIPDPPKVKDVDRKFPKGVRSIYINNHSVKVKLDSGKEELYDLNDAEQKAAFIKKYGELPKPPAPPPAPPAPERTNLPAPPAPPAPVGVASPGPPPAKAPTPPPPPKHGLPDPGVDQGIITAPPAGYAYKSGPKKYDPAHPIAGKIVMTNSKGVSTGSEPLYIVDGVEQSDGFSLGKLDPVEIESISILKDASYQDKYGERGKNGVILITTKGNKKGDGWNGNKTAVTMKEATLLKNSTGVVIKTKEPFKGIYVVNGKEYTPAEFEALQLDPGTIESVNVLKGESATSVYGDKAKEGAIVVITK